MARGIRKNQPRCVGHPLRASEMILEIRLGIRKIEKKKEFRYDGFSGIRIEKIGLEEGSLKRISLFLIFVFLLVSCSANRFKSEVDFANKLAQQGLWEEAYFRWAKTLESQKGSAVIYNNLAVYYEKIGKTKKAEEAYQKALKIEPGNKYVQSNYNKFKEKEEKKK